MIRLVVELRVYLSLLYVVYQSISFRFAEARFRGIVSKHPIFLLYLLCALSLCLTRASSYSYLLGFINKRMKKERREKDAKKVPFDTFHFPTFNTAVLSLSVIETESWDLISSFGAIYLFSLSKIQLINILKNVETLKATINSIEKLQRIYFVRENNWSEPIEWILRKYI